MVAILENDDTHNLIFMQPCIKKTDSAQRLSVEMCVSVTVQTSNKKITIAQMAIKL